MTTTTEVTVVKVENSVVVSATTETLTPVVVSPTLDVAAPGPQGPPGPPGAAGAPGGSVVAYTQADPAGTWAVEHNYNRPVFITVLNSAGEQVFPDVDQSDPNTVSIIFATPTSGKAVVS